MWQTMQKKEILVACKEASHESASVSSTLRDMPVSLLRTGLRSTTDKQPNADVSIALNACKTRRGV